MVVEAGTNQHAANGKAELFTGSGGRSLLCLASIKGNSAEDFLVGVMRANNCTEARLKRHRRFVGHASADELRAAPFKKVHHKSGGEHEATAGRAYARLAPHPVIPSATSPP